MNYTSTHYYGTVNNSYQETPECAPGVPTIGVVGNGFCVPYPVELIVNKTLGLSQEHFTVTDASGNLFLQVDGSVWTLQAKRVMRDPSGFPILTMHEKPLSWSQRWKVYQGESSDQRSLLFSVKRSDPLQMRVQLDAFLAGNFSEDVPNFRVCGSQSSDSFRVYKGDAVMAEVYHKFAFGSFFKGKESFRVKINPGADYAFIVALIVILYEVETI